MEEIKEINKCNLFDKCQFLRYWWVKSLIAFLFFLLIFWIGVEFGESHQSRHMLQGSPRGMSWGRNRAPGMGMMGDNFPNDGINTPDIQKDNQQQSGQPTLGNKNNNNISPQNPSQETIPNSSAVK
jgi:hypothetical protein